MFADPANTDNYDEALAHAIKSEPESVQSDLVATLDFSAESINHFGEKSSHDTSEPFLSCHSSPEVKVVFKSIFLINLLKKWIILLNLYVK